MILLPVFIVTPHLGERLVCGYMLDFHDSLLLHIGVADKEDGDQSIIPPE